MSESQPHSLDEPAIEMLGISKRFGQVVANDNVAFRRADWRGPRPGRRERRRQVDPDEHPGRGLPARCRLILRSVARPVEFRSPATRSPAGIGMVYQHFMLVDSFTVAENVAARLPTTALRLELRDDERPAAGSSASGTDWTIDPDATIWQFSVGEQQRVEIMRLLIRGARILVFDEPTAVLTPQESDRH